MDTASAACVPVAAKRTTSPAVAVTDDLDGAMSALRSKGVVFEEYDFPGMKTAENGVATLEGLRSAWFRDSEGNFICVSEM